MLARYYDWLSRYQQVVGWATRAGRGRCTIHRRLAPVGTGPRGDTLHALLLDAIAGVAASPRVVDAGCGLGGTVFFLHDRLGGQYDGLTISAVQRRRAEGEARRRGVAADCRFHLRSYDEDLRAIAPDGVDLVVAIESLLHAPDPPRTIANFAAALRPGGRFALIDDVPSPDLPDADADFQLFREGWSCPAVLRHDRLLAALAAAGLKVERDDDLSPRVPRRPRATLERLIGVNQLVRPLAGDSAAGDVLDGLHGGLMLERLYARGLIQYPSVPGPPVT